MKSSILILFAFGMLAGSLANQLPIYKICVPKIVHEQCLEFLENPPSNVAKVQCVTGRDRMDCLEKVNKREADFLFVDPEDMYVAYHMNNQDFSVFTEVRSNSEPLAEFRYEGVMLVRKGSNINSLAELQGKKACHTGYGRNVGYTIPITKLKNKGVLKISPDPTLSPSEHELKALSEFFSQACIVGKWSPNPKLNEAMKTRYANLCAMCDDPVKCGYPDKYSGYDGAIRCLDQNNGDVAFTKVVMVKIYFGLPIGNGNVDPLTQPEGNPDNFEYLCEDGSRRPITGPACSWAQRPWQGFMGHADVNARLEKLQNRIENFYTDGKQSPKVNETKKVNIYKDYIVTSKSVPIYPGEHLTQARYKDVIERDGGFGHKIRFCVSGNVELRKCDTMKRAAYSRGIRPDILCFLKSKNECIAGVNNNGVDIVAISPKNYAAARTADLSPVVYESFDATDVYVALVPKSLDQNILQKGRVQFDQSKTRSVNAALYLLLKLNAKKCPNELISENNSAVKIVRSSELSKWDRTQFELVCPDLSRKTFDNFKTCNFEFTLPTAVFAKSGLSDYKLQYIVHAFTALSRNFGHGANNEIVFELFGEFEEGERDIIFDDNASTFIAASDYTSVVDETQYNELRCTV